MANRDSVGLGWDVAGTVDAIGPNVTGFAIGDPVIGLRDVLDAPLGAHADYLVLDAGAFRRPRRRRTWSPRPHCPSMP